MFLGHWSAKAAKECAKYGTVNMVLPDRKKYSGIPPVEDWTFDPDASYFYYCDNETVHGKSDYLRILCSSKNQ